MAQIQGKLKLRAEKIAFLEMPETSGIPEGTCNRMQGFTSLSTSKNPREYTRQYVDETMEQTDVTGYSPSMAFAFDTYTGNAVHDYLAELIDNEVIGTAAVVNILTVDMNIDPEEANNAVMRSYSVIADNEGDSMDAYTYSGNFRVKGPNIYGKATLDDEELTATFVPDSEEEGP